MLKVTDLKIKLDALWCFLSSETSLFDARHEAHEYHFETVSSTWPLKNYARTAS